MGVFRRGGPEGRGRWRGSAGLLIALAVAAGAAFGPAGALAREDAASQLRACKAIADDGARLRCFDAAAASIPAAPAKGDVVLLEAPDEPAPAPVSPPAPAPRPGVRVQLGYGLSIGDYSGSSGVARHGVLTSRSATGGSGGGVLAEAWLDDWLHKDVSLGLGYVEVANNATVAATLPQGVWILTDPTYAQVSGAVRARLFMANLAYRPRAFGRIRPVLGFGLGGGPATVDGLQVFQNAFIGNGSARQHTASPVPAMQIYTGVQADLTRHLYIDLTPRLLWVGAAPFGNGLRYTDFILGTNLGYRF